jgi:hypothetical protein
LLSYTYKFLFLVSEAKYLYPCLEMASSYDLVKTMTFDVLGKMLPDTGPDNYQTHKIRTLLVKPRQ